jgi:hypothetical protein
MRLTAPPLLKDLVIVLQGTSGTTATAEATELQFEVMLDGAKHVPAL